MPSEKQGNPGPKDQPPSHHQQQQQQPPANAPADNTTTLPSRPKNPKPDAMATPSGGTSSHRGLPIQLRSQHEQSEPSSSGHHQQTSHGDSAADLFAVGAWADPQMGGVGPHDDFDTHLRSWRAAGSSASKGAGRK